MAHAPTAHRPLPRIRPHSDDWLILKQDRHRLPDPPIALISAFPRNNRTRFTFLLSKGIWAGLDIPLALSYASIGPTSSPVGTYLPPVRDLLLKSTVGSGGQRSSPRTLPYAQLLTADTAYSGMGAPDTARRASAVGLAATPQCQVGFAGLQTTAILRMIRISRQGEAVQSSTRTPSGASWHITPLSRKSGQRACFSHRRFSVHDARSLLFARLRRRVQVRFRESGLAPFAGSSVLPD